MNQDPTSRVVPHIQPHLHLVADFAYPQINAQDQNFILNELQKAPRVVDNVAFSWQFLDAPPDGTMLLMYHPPQKAQFFASDGYIWTQEQYFRHNFGPNVVEVFSSSNGYNPAIELRQSSPAAHCRQRYRLIPDPNNPQSKGNPALWIVHYRRADRLMPATSIPVTAHEQQSINTRNYLKHLGHLQEKKFHLADIANWPTVTLPEQAAQHNALTFINGQMANRMQMHLQQQQAFSRDHGPSPKRQRQSNSTSHRAPPLPPQQAAPVLDEEDLAEEDRRDVFDILTQRDISQMRFRNHEEWMEELFSGYATFDIKPVDLGFERAGFMQPITEGFFNKVDRAPTPPNESWKQTPEHYDSITAKPLDPSKTKQFARAVEKRIADNNAQIAEMKRIHEERMKSLTKGSLLRDAAASIRGEQQSSHSKPDTSDETRNEPVIKEESIEDITKRVESLLGKTITSRYEVKLISKGGLTEEIAPKPQPGANGLATTSDGTNLFDDFLETADSNQASNKATPQPPATASSTAQLSAPVAQTAQADDWVMVNKSEAQPPANPATAAAAAPTAQAPTPNLDLPDSLVDFGPSPAADDNDGAGADNAFDDAMHFDTLDTPGNIDAGSPGFGPDTGDVAGEEPMMSGALSGDPLAGEDIAMDDVLDDNAFGEDFAATTGNGGERANEGV